MKQVDLGLSRSSKLTRKREFLDEMNRVMPWAALVELISPYYLAGRLDRRPFAVESMLLIQFMRQILAAVNDVTEGNSLLHAQKTDRFGDAGYESIVKRPYAKARVNWHVAMRYGKRKTLNKNDLEDSLIKGAIRAKVKHTFRVLKCQFGWIKVRDRELKRNIAQITTLFALSNLRMARHNLIGAQA